MNDQASYYRRLASQALSQLHTVLILSDSPSNEWHRRQELKWQQLRHDLYSYQNGHQDTQTTGAQPS